MPLGVIDGGARIVLAAGAAIVEGVPRRAIGVTAFLSCEAPHVDATMLADAKVLAIAAAGKWISGSGTIDAAGIKLDAGQLKSDLLRCAWDGAIAALTAPAPSAPAGRPAAAATTIDAAQVRATWAAVRGELGWLPAQGGV